MAFFIGLHFHSRQGRYLRWVERSSWEEEPSGKTGYTPAIACVRDAFYGVPVEMRNIFRTPRRNMPDGPELTVELPNEGYNY